MSEAPRSSVEKTNVDNTRDASSDATSDKAGSTVLDYGGDSSLPPPPKLTPEQEYRLYRKLDLRLMPILSLMYLLSFMDRGNIGNAKIEGLTTQLHLHGHQYNIALTMFFIPYCLFECPANLVIKKLRPSSRQWQNVITTLKASLCYWVASPNLPLFNRWLPGIAIVWGTVMTLMGLVKTYQQLVGVRVCLGVAEAGLFPGVVYYLTLWYPRHKLQFRIGLFFGAASVAGAFSGLLAFGISFMKGVGGLEGWSWIFILEGIATVLVGILAAFVLVDFPATATFLTPEERSYVVWRKKYDNSSVGEQEKFALRYVKDAFFDWQIWLHILIYMSIIGPLYGISLFLPSIISGFGFSVPVSQLLTVPPYVCATILLLIFAYYSDKLQLRFPFVLAGLTMLLIGFSIQISDAPRGAKYFGTFLCVGGSYATFPGIVAWLGNNLAGQYKRGVGMALQIGIGNFSGAIASNIFRTQDEPRYIVGHGVELMFVGMGFICVPLAVLLYKRTNAKRDAFMASLSGDSEKAVEGKKNYYGYTPQELRDLGDRAPDFRYTI